MTDADPAFWTGHAPLLFPIVGALNGGAYRLGDQTFAMPKHGFARHSHFELLGQDDHEARFGLFDSEETRAAYPFAFALQMVFRLQGWTLAMEITVTNRGDMPMPFSCGLHPAFAWPLPGGATKDAHRITFAADEPQPIRRIDPPSGLVLPERQATPVEGKVLVPDATLFEPDALIWDSLASRSLTYGAPGSASLAIAFPDTPMLGIWQKPGAHYLCIEPWQGIADPMGYAGDFRGKPGVIVLPPAEERSYRMVVTVDPA
jgi:galactose mutarotase-like enzyme